MRPSTRLPPFANVEKARAISSGFTASTPSPIAKYSSSGLVIPSRCAICATFFGPTSAVSCAYTELSECVVASKRLMRPR